MGRGVSIRRRHKAKCSRRQVHRVKRIFGDQQIAEHWDARATTRQNLERLGIARDYNDIATIKAAAEGRMAKAAADWASVKVVRADLEAASKRPADHVPEEVALYLDALTAKHPDDDFKAMERDKANNMFRTAAWIKARVERLRRYRAALAAAEEAKDEEEESS